MFLRIVNEKSQVVLIIMKYCIYLYIAHNISNVNYIKFYLIILHKQTLLLIIYFVHSRVDRKK